MTERAKRTTHEKARSWLPEETRQHLKAVGAEMRASIEALFPPEFIAHGRRARREALLAARSLIDQALARIEERESPS